MKKNILNLFKNSQKQSNFKMPVIVSAPRPQNSGYSHGSASHTKRAFKGFTAQSNSANQDIHYNNLTMRQRGRIIFMSCPWGTSAIKAYRTNVVGPGLRVKPKIKGELLGLSDAQTVELQKQIEREFNLWAENKRACDATGMNDFYGMQQLALMSWLMSGDVFALKKHYKTSADCPYSTRWHLIEADRIATPTNSGAQFASFNLTDGVATNGNRIFDGVEVNKNGLVEAYYICNHYPREVNTDPTEYVRVKALGEHTGLPNILHVMNSERPDQYRGVSLMAQVIEPLLQSKRYADAELQAAIIENFYTGFVTSETPEENILSETGSGDDTEPEVSDNDRELELGAGTIQYLKPGENITFSDPKRPNSGFTGFMEAQASQIGAGVEVPPEMLTKRFNSNYSASRAAYIEAWRSFRMYRNWFISDFCNPIYESIITEAVALGRISAPGFFDNPVARKIYLNCEWIGPAMAQIDPLKEIQALAMAIDTGVITRENATMTYSGADYFDNALQLKFENDALAKAKAPLTALTEPQTTTGAEQNATDDTDEAANRE